MKDEKSCAEHSRTLKIGGALMVNTLGALLCMMMLLADVRAAEAAPSPYAGEVFEWNIFAAELVSDQLPAIQTHVLALAQLAIHDALNAIDSRYQSYEYNGSAPGASVGAAVAAAAHDILGRMLPGAAPQVDTQYLTKLATIPDGTAKTAGIWVGQSAAATILARRGNEDLFAALGKRYVPGPTEPGIYQPTPPFNTVFLAGWGELTPFALRNSSQFRSAAPLSLRGRGYAEDYREVKELGSAASLKRNSYQTETAHFWFDVVTKEWHKAARKGLTDVAADEWQAARTLALLSVAMADGVIASADTKFAFNFWRPITAIQAGDRDGNFATRGDAAWQPLCGTPPFPEHNSTHAVTGAAAAKVLAMTIGDRHEFVVDSPTLAGVSHKYQRFSAAAFEEGLSRIFCGIHFRNGMNAGLEQGKRVARHVVKNLLRPNHGGHRDE